MLKNHMLKRDYIKKIKQSTLNKTLPNFNVL